MPPNPVAFPTFRRPAPDASPAPGATADNALAILDDHEARIRSMETVIGDLDDLAGVMRTATRLFKLWAPIIATAAISSGFIGGKLGLFVNAVVKGFTGQ